MADVSSAGGLTDHTRRGGRRLVVSHSRECPEGLPLSPARSGCWAGLTERLFLYDPAHRAQMFAETQGGRVLARGKVGAGG